MNNENIARIRTAWTMVGVMILTLFFGANSEVHALPAIKIVYNKNILYINKFINLVNIKDIINIDYNNKKNNSNEIFIVDDLATGKTFTLPAYSIKLNLKSRVAKQVIISRLANGIKSQETGGVGEYLRASYSSSACGAYQYMPESWGNFMGYKNACDAPSWVQDLRMTDELQASYAKYHSWPKAVAAHLYPSRAGNMKTWNLRVPGNPTLYEYVASVFQKANIAF